MSGIILAATGHRPDKLGGYDNQLAQTALVRVAMDELREIRPAWVLSGMALGWDQAIAQAAIELQIPLAAVIPCAGQESRWPGVAQDYYQRLRQCASWEIVLAPAYSSSCMQARNVWLVNYSTHLLALWNGSSGGTANCVRYAQQVGRPIRNCWSRWTAMPESRSRYSEAIPGLDYTDADIPF